MVCEKEYLTNYDMDMYDRPTGYTSDIVLFTLVETDCYDDINKAFKRDLQFLLVKRNEHPYKGFWALPGGFVVLGESSHECAIRRLEEETGLKDIYIKHFGIYDEYERDPRGNKWVVSNAHYSIVNEKYLFNKKVGISTEDIKMFSYNELENLNISFDHKKIIADAYNEVKKEMHETVLAKEFLNKEFFLSDLYMVLKSIGDYNTQKSNFFNKVSKLDFIEAVTDEEGNVKKSKSHVKAKRLSTLYKFTGVNKSVSIY